MKPTKEQVEAYKAMAKSSPMSMESMIKAHLVANCPKFIESKLDGCLKYLTACAREILDSKSGEVADDVCYKICRDYFNDEVWKQEEEEAKNKAAKTSAKKQNSVVAKCSVDDVTDEDDDNDDTVCETPAVQPKKKEADQLDMFAALGV